MSSGPIDAAFKGEVSGGWVPAAAAAAIPVEGVPNAVFH